MQMAAGYYKQQLKSAPNAISYLKGRGLSGEVAARFGLGYAPDGWQSLEAVFPDYQDDKLIDTGLVIVNEEKGQRYDRFRDRVMFPIRNQRGAIIGFGGRVMGKGEPKYLNSPETPLFEKGRELYGLYEARQAIRDKTVYWWSKAIWTWWRWRNSASLTRSPRWAPPPPASMRAS